MNSNTEYLTFALRFVAVLHLVALSVVMLFCTTVDYGFGTTKIMIAFFLATCSVWLIYLSVCVSSSEQQSPPSQSRFQSTNSEL